MNSKSIMESDEGVSNIPKFKYDVFLSFRGSDTRVGFTGHLYHRLTDAGIRVFIDDKELIRGEEIEPQLLKGIKESKIAIPIFSKGYAASKWLLKELAQIVECKRSTGLKVMPIFYDVTPSEVRHPTRDYAIAFESHKAYCDENTINSWKAALREVGALRGWDFYQSNSRFFKIEAELIKEVTEVVLRELKKSYLVTTDYLVGVEHHVEEILGMLSANISAVQILGIYGMGGIGKTTLAKVIYNRLLPDFDRHSFLANIREIYQSRGMKFLSTKLINDILGNELADVSNDDEGIRIIKERFSNNKVLILLDDVDHISQLRLFKKRDCFGCGSRIIITTRNRSILDSFQVDVSYELPGLEPNQALKLLSKHAFRENSPPEEYSTYAQNVVQIAKGLPLALEVLGSSLFGKSMEVWRDTLKKLQNVHHEDVREKLRVSYEALDNKQKEVFLDIACFFNEEDYGLIIHFWEDQEDAMEVLREMSLVKIVDHKLWMHDQLRDLGKKIVGEEQTKRGKQSMPWITEKQTEYFMRNEGDEDIKFIRLNMGQRSGHHFTSDKFANLPNLRLLHVKYDSPHLYDPIIVEAKNFEVISKGCLRRGHPFIFSELRWLSLHWFLGMRMTKNVTFQKLAILDLSYSGIKSSWSGWSHIKVAKNLKVLNLTGCWRLVKTPNFSCHLLLEQLILEDCWELVEIDKSISLLEHLVIINLKGCRRLKKLPKNLKCVESLEELIISFTSIIEIPSWPLMRRLKVFNSFSCYYLKKVSSLDFAANITELSLASSKITLLPDSIRRLVNLLKLSLKWCKGVKTLPESIGDLVSLVELKLKSSGIEELPNTIGKLSKLETITISSTPLRKLPPEIGMMEKLMSINAWNCSELHDIPELPQSLISLEVSKARIQRIPDLSNLINLKKLEVLSCPDLVEITGRLESLSTLKLWDCQSLQKFADIQNRETMELCSIKDCEKLN